MPTASVRRVPLQASLRDAEVAAYGKLTMEESSPHCNVCRACARSRWMLEREGCERISALGSRWRMRASTNVGWPMPSCVPSLPKPLLPGIGPQPARYVCGK